MTRPTYLQIDLEAIRHNVRVARIRAPGSRLMACVKANAYGHGMVAVAKAIADEVDGLAVACLDEAMTLRHSGIQTPILLLEGCFEPQEYAIAAKHGIWAVIHQETQVQWLEQIALNTPITLWVKIDTGMFRLGVLPSQAATIITRLQGAPNVASIVAMTHFACADELSNDQTRQQIHAFDSALKGVEVAQSLANSAGILNWVSSHRDWVRPGYMLYGNDPSNRVAESLDLRCAMTFRSQVIATRTVQAGEGIGYNHQWVATQTTRVATVAAGYGDGYPRDMPDGAPVLVDGRRAQKIGRVSMDMILVDVTHIPSARLGSEVELWGPNLPLTELAIAAQMSGYELITRIPGRINRRYSTESS